MTEWVIPFSQLGISDIEKVGGKNASLGEMIGHLSAQDVPVPDGFATTASAYRLFLHENHLDEKIYSLLDSVSPSDINDLTQKAKDIRAWILAADFSKDFIAAVSHAYDTLMQDAASDLTFAVRSSATAEDLPDASFAGQQETYLNVSGFDHLLIAIKQVFASLFTNRAITYRIHNGFDHRKVALSAGIQRMVRSDLACSGVMFTVDTESGFDQVVLITAAYGLGETVVQGMVNPDEYILFKPNLTNHLTPLIKKTLGKKAIKMIYDASQQTKVVDVAAQHAEQFALTTPELTKLGEYALKIEKHYQKPMDIEWAKDGKTGQLFIVQARPETVTSRRNRNVIEQYRLTGKGKILVTGSSIGEKIAAGPVSILESVDQMALFNTGDILVADITDPDWEPVMEKAAAIVTNRGGRTCHAAIIARELGIPAIVGCGNATAILKDGKMVTVSCAGGDRGSVYEGKLDFECNTLDVSTLPEPPLKMMMNLGNPNKAFSLQAIPNQGVGLARMEFIIENMIAVHPNACLDFKKLSKTLQQEISNHIAGYKDPVNFYIERLKEGVATIAAAFYPKQVIIRTSDFKSNEYANLLGGSLYEPQEENPMIGFRGASRYVAASFRPCFELECHALKAVRDELGLTNLAIMIPFVRTISEAEQTLSIMAHCGLVRGENGLKVMMMCEVPSNVLLAEAFLSLFDGFSIGSNDLTQLTLGVDRDSDLLAHLFDERDPAVKLLLQKAISECNRHQKYIGICGQGPSDHPDLAQWLREQNIQSLSLNPDTVVSTWVNLAKT